MLKGSDLTASGHFHQVTKFDVSIVPFWVEIEGLVNASLACKCMSIITFHQTGKFALAGEADP